MYANIPDKILSALQLPSKDKGIDLLAKIKGEYYAIQCKFRQNPDVIISWAELSTFFGLSFGLNNKIKGGFLVTNTCNLCDEVIKSTKIKAIYDDFFNDLPNNFFECIRNTSTRIKYTIKKPMLHQRECIVNAQFHYLDFNRGLIEMACGSGKTLTSYWIDKKTSNKNTVIFVPSLYLLSQFYSDWINQSYAEKNKINYLLIGCDADIDDDTKYKSNGLILHTDPILIKKYIKSIKGKLVVICTYQSSDKLAEACHKISFDFGIFDEAHKTVGQAGKKFSLMLDDKQMVIKNRLFMTATPKMYSGDLDKEDIISMDNKKIYGEKFYAYNTGNAIKDNRLVDYQVISLYAKNTDVKKIITKNKLVKYRKEFDDFNSNYLGIIILLLKKIHDGTCKHLITYHNTIKHAQIFSDILDKINDLLYDDEIFVGHLSGDTSMKRRNKMIKDFVSSDRAVLCSARVLNEGVNIPIVDSVCFVDARFSTIDIVQCIGRALRLYENKTMAHVIVPIFIDNFEDDFDSDAHGNVIRILKALKTTDEGIVEYFKLKQAGGNGGSRNILANEFYGEEKYSREIDLEEWNKAISDKIWRVIDNFDYMYEKVKKWVDENGRIPSNKSKNIIEKNIGIWCSSQRQRYKRKTLSDDNIINLEKINRWYWEKEDNFDKKYIEVKKWINDNNGKIPSRGNKYTLEKKLGTWCSNRRKDKYKLSDEKIKKLEQIKTWFWSDPNKIKNTKSFHERYGELVTWLNNNNNVLPLRNSSDSTEKSLCGWCDLTRKKYKNNKLTQNEIKKMEQIKNWYWKVEDPFYVKYKQLAEWININNKLPYRDSEDINENKLGKWCDTLRTNYYHDKLLPDKIKKMEEISLWYWKKEDDFDDKYNKLKKWIELNNKLPSHGSKDATEKKLCNWCSRLRINYKEKKITEEKIKKLEKISLWYWPDMNKAKKIKKSFDERYIELNNWIKQYHKLPSHGSKISIEKSIGEWCHSQRCRYIIGSLESDKIKKLEKIKIWFWERIENYFDEMYDKLNIWVNENNKLPSRSSDSQHEKSLATWCDTQKRNYYHKRLPSDKIEKLEKINNWHWTKQDNFNKRYTELINWISINNKIPTQHEKKIVGKKLGIWCNRQRLIKRQNKLSKDKIKQLEKIKGWTWQGRNNQKHHGGSKSNKTA